jgi:hypothetical protein
MPIGNFTTLNTDCIGDIILSGLLDGLSYYPKGLYFKVHRYYVISFSFPGFGRKCVKNACKSVNPDAEIGTYE